LKCLPKYTPFVLRRSIHWLDLFLFMPWQIGFANLLNLAIW
jgi:hypothetical protein